MVEHLPSKQDVGFDSLRPLSRAESFGRVRTRNEAGFGNAGVRADSSMRRRLTAAVAQR